MVALVVKAISLFLLLVAFLLLLAATVGNKWLVYDTDHIGLWLICRENHCAWMQYSPSYLIAFLDWFSCVRAFMLLSCIFTFLALLVQTCNFRSEVHCSIGVVRTLMVFTGIFVMIAVVVFVTQKHKNYESSWEVGWSIIVACVAWVVAFLIVAFLCFVGAPRKTGRRFTSNAMPAAPPAQTIKGFDLPDMPGPVTTGDTLPLIDEKPPSVIASQVGSSASKKSSIASKKESAASEHRSVSFEKGSASSLVKEEESEYSDSDSYTGSEGSSYTSSSTAATVKGDFV